MTIGTGRAPHPRTTVGSVSTIPLAAPAAGRRLRASLGDLAPIACWFGLLTGAGAAVRAMAPAGQPPLLATDVAVFTMTVLPVGVHLSAGEAGAHQASWGKRRAGLRVVTDGGGRPSVRRIVARTAVKLLPWQLAHIAVARLILDVDDPAVTWTAYALSLAVPLLSVTVALRDPRQRALHDRVAGTRVVTF
jgi:uncharacterized RDD family membrane protein YckC